MTSVLNVDTIADKAGTGPVAFTKQEAAKGRVRISYSSGTPSQDDTFNHSSITDSGTGFATLNLSNSMSNINYTTTQTNGGLATDRYGWGQTQMNNSATFTANTTSTYVCVWLSYVPNFRDPDRASFVIHGDLA